MRRPTGLMLASVLAVTLTLLVELAFVPPATAQQAPSATPSPSATELSKSIIHSRAFEAVVWGMPAVNAELMYEALAQNGGAFNQIVYWSALPSWKNQTLTPNPDAIYLMPFFNTKDVGPMVLEIPPADGGSITGNVDDIWQTPLEDVGPAGVDKGKGCKCLILPPGYKGTVPSGYTALPSEVYEGFALLRSILKSGSAADVAKAVAYGKRVKLYPLSQAANPPATKFVDALNVVFEASIPYDLRYFQSLDRIVQSQPWLERDKAMIDQLKSIGIEKGKPFNPNPETQQILKDAAQEAHLWFETRYATLFAPPFFAGTHWALPILSDVAEAESSGFANPDAYPVDDRGLTYTYGFVGIKHLGAGQYYLMTIADKDGLPFKGSNTYRMTVPANVPVTQYWSMTVYNRETHTFVRNVAWESRSSNTPALQQNADGSVTIYFAPTAPSGKSSNWIPTDSAGTFEVLARFYGPEKALFDKTWVMSDIERVK
jgi:hypothetical protein